ncbi:PepSY-associated TM helix domain-containing protein [Flavobacterium daejeonense]|uniref:PepSY-associated TM helix domain-containing protein n=1 Tax=Flavobacterium daejeonense TaxID=350893 RepID=UPI00047BBBF7|nr:PepSY-associated TM helix domain-containing protein [Flavobacterium daejeonense]
MNKQIKKSIGKIHLWLGLSSGLVVFIVALTGSILVFEEEINTLIHPEFYKVKTVEKSRIPIDCAVKTLKKEYATDSIIRIYTFNDPKRTVLIMGKNTNGNILFFAINPYTGKIISSIEQKKHFFSITNKLHRSLLLGKTGKLITGCSCLIFIIILLSGLFLWWPKKLKNLKQRLTIKWDASFKRVNWDIHSVLGFYSFLFLLIIALTGLTWSFKWFENSLYYLTDGIAKKPSIKVANPPKTELLSQKTFFYQSIMDQTNKIYSYQGNVQIRMPNETVNSILVTKENIEKVIPNQSGIAYFDRYTAKIIQTKPYESFTKGDKLRRIIYPIHTGSIYGLPTKIIAFLVCLFAASAPITGFLIWWRRKKKNH